MAVLGEDCERGQLLIVTAIGLAVMLLVMTLVLNTAVVGTVHVSQTDESLKEERGARQYEDSVRRATAGHISAINTGANPAVNDSSNEYFEIVDTLDNEIDQWDELAEPEYERDSVTATVSLDNVIFDTTIVQNNQSRTYVDNVSNPTWVLAGNVTGVREFEMNVSDEHLVETDDCAGGQDCYTLEVEGSNGSFWNLFVYTPNNHTGIAITVDPSDGETVNCDTTDVPVRINVTNGSFYNGEDCGFTSFLDDQSVEPPYTLTYMNGDNASGTYELTVNGKLVNETIEQDERYTVDDSPTLVPRIDGAVVSLRYRSVDLVYGIEFRVIPREKNG